MTPNISGTINNPPNQAKNQAASLTHHNLGHRPKTESSLTHHNLGRRARTDHSDHHLTQISHLCK
jgi:hypothetical protein